MFYLHPVTGPAWLAACLLTVLIFSIKVLGKGWWRSFFPSLMVALLGLVPFVKAYFLSGRKSTIDPKLLSEIIAARYSEQIKPVVSLYKDWIQNYVFKNPALLILTAFLIAFTCIGFIYLKRNPSRPLVRDKALGKVQLYLGIWWFSILTFAVIVPLIDEGIAALTGNDLLVREIRRSLR